MRPAPSLAKDDTTHVSAAQMIKRAPDAQPEVAVRSIPTPMRALEPPAAPERQRANASAVEPREAAPPIVDESMPVPDRLPSPAAPPPPAPPAASAPAKAAGKLEAAPPEADRASTPATQASERAARLPANAPAAGASSDAFTRNTPPAQEKAEMADVARPTAPKATRPSAVAPVLRNEAEMAADGGFVDDPVEDIPPATAASPAVRDAWLHRIGELLEQGKRQEATASLAEFRRRYPNAVLPPALRALELEH
jgi:hypothetical protein